MAVGIVLVAHNARLAEGLAEYITSVAPEVPVRPAGGLPDGGHGADYGIVRDAVDQADTGAGVVLLYDLGSTQMIAELVVEGRDDKRSYVVEAPLVEGAIAAAIASAGGASLDDVASAAASAGSGGEIEEADSDEL